MRNKTLSRSNKIMAMKMSKAGKSGGEIAKELDVLATPLNAYLKKKWLELCNEALHDFVIARDRACVTCGSVKNLQAGHFIPGRHHSVLFNLTNVHAQCEICNMFKDGNLIEYTRFMQKKYGDDKIDELKWMDKQIVKLTVDKLQEIYGRLTIGEQ